MKELKAFWKVLTLHSTCWLWSLIFCLHQGKLTISQFECNPHDQWSQYFLCFYCFYFIIQLLFVVIVMCCYISMKSCNIIWQYEYDEYEFFFFFVFLYFSNNIHSQYEGESLTAERTGQFLWCITVILLSLWLSLLLSCHNLIYFCFTAEWIHNNDNLKKNKKKIWKTF